MSLKAYREITHNNVKLVSGHAYKFRYSAYQNDPAPTIFFINAIRGIHPNTGHQWRLIQGININYVARKDRKRFVDLWKRELSHSTRPHFTWDRISVKYPKLKNHIRRYMLKPNYYIRDLAEIPPEQYDDMIVKSWFKDFSDVTRRTLGAKIKRFFTGERRR